MSIEDLAKAYYDKVRSGNESFYPEWDTLSHEFKADHAFVLTTALSVVGITPEQAARMKKGAVGKAVEAIRSLPCQCPKSNGLRAHYECFRCHALCALGEDLNWEPGEGN